MGVPRNFPELVYSRLSHVIPDNLFRAVRKEIVVVVFGKSIKQESIRIPTHMPASFLGHYIILKTLSLGTVHNVKAPKLSLCPCSFLYGVKKAESHHNQFSTSVV